MRVRDLARVGHLPSLLGSLLHFEVSFGVWVLLGALGPFVARDLELGPAMKGLVVATPLLSAAGFRVLGGWLADRFGPRRVGTATLLLTLAPLTWGWVGGRELGEVLGIAVLLGVAGASFAIAMPLASAHYPPSHQGLALGIAGAGNSGTIVAGLVAPRVAEHIGWHATFGLAMLPVGLGVIGFRMLAREAPRQGPARALREALAPIRVPECWRLCGLYAVTFGGYVGLTSYLPVFFVDRFGMSRVAAASIAAAAAGAGSLLRPAGGILADRVGGTRVLRSVYPVTGILVLALAAAPRPATAAAAGVALLGVLGVGNGAVFQLVPRRFPSAVGMTAGIIGAAGGIGGFLLPTALGIARGAAGSYVAGFGVYSAAVLLAFVAVRAMDASSERERDTRAVEEAA